jgi:hypothetical protein
MPTLEAGRAEALYIWWLDQPAWEAAERDHRSQLAHLPRYLIREFRSREGRGGRLRLWVAPHLPRNVRAAPMGKTNGAWPAYLNDDMGGLVFEAQYLPLLAGLPGVITDLRLRQIPRTDSPSHPPA